MFKSKSGIRDTQSALSLFNMFGSARTAQGMTDPDQLGHTPKAPAHRLW